MDVRTRQLKETTKKLQDGKLCLRILVFRVWCLWMCVLVTRWRKGEGKVSRGRTSLGGLFWSSLAAGCNLLASSPPKSDLGLNT